MAHGETISARRYAAMPLRYLFPLARHSLQVWGRWRASSLFAILRRSIKPVALDALTNQCKKLSAISQYRKSGKNSQVTIAPNASQLCRQ